MSTVTKRVLLDKSGSTAVLFAVCVTAICLSAGVAIDYLRAHDLKTNIQRAVDAAALAGAAMVGVTDGERTAAATKYFAENVTEPLSASPTISASGGLVSVSIDTVLPTTLMKLGGITNVTVTANAIATAERAATPCVLTLEETEFGLQSNSDSTLDAACAIHVNSAHNEAIFANSNGEVIGTSVCVHGTSHTNSGGTVTPEAIEDCPPFSDPLASLPDPAEAYLPCDFTDYTVNAGSTATMIPGVYCGATLINSSSAVTMQPGIYVFRGGEFVTNSLSSVTGDRVMLYFADKDSRLNVNSGSLIQITAPTTGTYAGILMFQSRDSTTLTAPPFIINSDGTTKLEGVIYLANGLLELNSISTANGDAAYTAIITNQFVLNSYGTFKINADYSGSTPIPTLLSGINSPTPARLIQ